MFAVGTCRSHVGCRSTGYVCCRSHAGHAALKQSPTKWAGGCWLGKGGDRLNLHQCVLWQRLDGKARARWWCHAFKRLGCTCQCARCQSRWLAAISVHGTHVCTLMFGNDAKQCMSQRHQRTATAGLVSTVSNRCDKRTLGEAVVLRCKHTHGRQRQVVLDGAGKP